jgi:hypothetical protein
MGQLISSQGGKRSQNDLNVSRPVGTLPTKVGFENSTHYLPRLKIGLENEKFDLTQWEPQQLITTYVSNGVRRIETPLEKAKISSSSRVLEKHQTITQSDSIKTIKQPDEEEFGLSSDGRIILDEEDFTQSPIDSVDSQHHEENIDKSEGARNLSARSRTQHDRKVLMNEVHRLLHSASLDDMPQTTSYLKTHESFLIPDCRYSFNAIDIC